MHVHTPHLAASALLCRLWWEDTEGWKGVGGVAHTHTGPGQHDVMGSMVDNVDKLSSIFGQLVCLPILSIWCGFPCHWTCYLVSRFVRKGLGELLDYNSLWN